MPNLRAASLTGAVLKDVSSSLATISELNLPGVNQPSRVDLRSANLSGANLSSVNFKRC